MKVAIYTRVSKSDGSQATDRQILDLSRFCEERDWEIVTYIEEKISGRIKRREGTEQLIRLARGNRIQKVLVHEISRLGRNLSDVVQTVEELSLNKVSVYDYRQRMETLDEYYRKTPFATMVIPVLAGIAEEHAAQQSHRIKSGLQRAREQGKEIGRPKGRPIKFERKIVALLAQGMSVRKTAREVGVANSTVQRVSKKLTSSAA